MKEFTEKYKKACELIDTSDGFAERTVDRVLAQRRTVTRTVGRKTAVVLIAAVLALVMAAGSVFAAEYIRRSRLSDTAEFGMAADEYVLPVEQSVTKKGITLALDEAVYDNGILYVSLAWAAEGYGDILYASANDSSVRLDGRQVPAYSIMSSVMEIDGESFMVFEYDLGELAGAHDITLTFSSVDLMTADGFECVDGKWKFSFDFDASALSEQTTVYTIDERITLENGDAILLDRIVCTPVSQRLEYEILTADDDRYYYIDAVATDDVGGEYEFAYKNGRNCTGECVNTSPDSFSPDAREIKLVLTITDRYDSLLADGVTVTATRP